MLGADLIGFHTNDYVQHFLKSVREIVGHENKLREIRTPERTITVDTFPISIDYSKFNQTAGEASTFDERNKIKKRLNGSKLIISVDRLDYAKGLSNRLQSYALFLEQNPEFRSKVIYIMLVVPSRDIIPKYNETKKEIEGLVSGINGRYGSLHWTPVVYQYTSVRLPELVGLYLAADVALISPMRDGMNLVAKEFIASRVDKRGVLILSETAGASAELGESLLVNPTDHIQIAQSIKTALEMPVDEQTARNETMQARIREYDVSRWAEDFIFQLNQTKLKQKALMVKEINGLLESQITTQFNESEKRLFLLDYDGTLTPIARMPHLAVPGDELYELLSSLAFNPKTEVVVISGRPINVLEKWFGELPVNLVAEHGAFHKMKGSNWVQTLPLNASWKDDVIQTMQLLTERCQGTFIEEKSVSLAWHYRNAEKELGFLRSRELINALTELASHLDFQVIEGNKVIEARARGVDKGVAARIWLKKQTWDFILAAGDDRTDEDMFKVLPKEAYSIRIGLLPSAARFNFRFQHDVIKLLKKIKSDTSDSEKSYDLHIV
jgi:trehalose 6-phosphate synthase/phosphatase